MKNWAIGILSIISIICVICVVAMYTDNRHLREDMIKILAQKSTQCPDDSRFETMLDVCEAVSRINRQQEAYLNQVRETLEGVDEQRRRAGDGKVWRASGPGKDRGLGEGGRGVGGP